MKYLLVMILVLNVCFINAVCWDDEEISDIEFMELDNVIVISIKNALDCSPVTGAEVSMIGQKVKTDVNGYVNIPLDLIEEIEDEDIPFTVTKNGFISLNSFIEVRMGSTITKHFLMSPEMPLEKVRFVLQWGKYPTDLDIHLKSDDFHVSYRNMINVEDEARLDRDDTSSYGPETITVDDISDNKNYKLFVHNYSNNGRISNEVKVYIYANNRLDRIIELESTNKRYVNVLSLRNGEFNYINQAMDVID